MARFIGRGLDSNFMTATLHQKRLKLTGTHRTHKNKGCQGRRRWIKSTTDGDCLNVIDALESMLILIFTESASCCLVIGTKRNSLGRDFHHSA